MGEFKYLQTLLDEYIEEAAQLGEMIAIGTARGHDVEMLKQQQRFAKLQANEIAKVAGLTPPFVID